MTELREPTYLAMVALAGQPLHGYGIIEEVVPPLAGPSNLKAGTLYALLDRLELDGLVKVEQRAGRRRSPEALLRAHERRSGRARRRVEAAIVNLS